MTTATRVTASPPDPLDGTRGQLLRPYRQRRHAVEHPVDPGGVEVAAEAVARLQPRTGPGPAAVAGVDAGHPRLPEAAQHVPVVGPERDGHPRHPGPGPLVEHLVRL